MATQEPLIDDNKNEKLKVDDQYVEIDISQKDIEQETLINANLDAVLEANPNAMPKAIYFIIPNEFGERFTYYGISPLVNRYFQFLGASMVEAKQYTHYWKMFTYFFPLLGAALSDSYFGKYKTIFYMSAIYLIGNIMMVITSIPQFRSLVSVSVALYLIAIGTGGIKPCVAPHGGDQYLASQVNGLRQFFAFFYMSINLGSMLSGFLTPSLVTNIGCWGDSIKEGDIEVGRCYMASYILTSTVFMLSYAIFVYGEKYYRVVPPIKKFLPYRLVQVVCTSIYAFLVEGKRPEQGMSLFSLANHVHGERFALETAQFLHVFKQLFPISFVWMIYDQQSTEWQNQYDRMYQYFGPIYMSPEIMTSVLNPIMIVTAVWLLSTYVYPALDKRGLQCTPLRRMGLGCILVGFSFLVSGLLQYWVVDQFDGMVDDQNKQQIVKDQTSCPNCVHGAYQIPQWLLLSLGEALFSPTGNEFAYTQVSPATSAMCTSFWYLLVGLGNMYVSVLEKFVGGLDWALDEHGNSTPIKFFMYTGICLVASSWFIVMACTFKYRSSC